MYFKIYILINFQVGEYLKEKFDRATEVKPEVLNGRVELRPNQQFFKRPSESDLVYLTKSPEYCERDLRHGSLGTSGRRCNKVRLEIKYNLYISLSSKQGLHHESQIEASHSHFKF